MPVYSLNINKRDYKVEVASGTPLLWVIREDLKLTGTKYGCGVAQCGSCTVHLDDVPVRSCVLTVDAVKSGQRITTIEGLSDRGDHALQKAWIAEQVPQCGYCQSGQIMQAAALLKSNPRPTRDEIKTHMNGNLCRCGTYMRIARAVEVAARGELAANDDD